MTAAAIDYCRRIATMIDLAFPVINEEGSIANCLVFFNWQLASY